MHLDETINSTLCGKNKRHKIHFVIYRRIILMS